MRCGRFLAALAVVVAACRPALPAVPTAPLYGDANGDGQVNIADVTIDLRLAVGLATPTADQMIRLDIAPLPGVGTRQGQPWGDGRITLADVTPLLRHVVGLPTDQWPVAEDHSTFSWIQRNIFTSSCALSSCHSAAAHQANLSLDPAGSWQSLVGRLAFTRSARDRGQQLVVPGDPDHSFLLTKLTNPGPDDGRIMPFGTPGLDPNLVAIIRAWIANGAKPDLGDLTGPPDVPPVPDSSKPDVSLSPPPPGQGFQIAVGPFPVNPGQEVRRDYYFQLPNETGLDITRLEFLGNPGTHHWFLYRNGQPDYPSTPITNPPADQGTLAVTMDGMTVQPAVAIDNDSSGLRPMANGWDIVAGSDSAAWSFTMPTGVGSHLDPHQVVDMQVHYVNAANGQYTPNGRGKMLLNLWTVPSGSIPIQLASTLYAQNPFIVIPPHSHPTFYKLCPFPNGAKILWLTTHFHSRGKVFTLYRWDGSKPTDMLMQSTDWNDPQIKAFDPPLELKPGEGIYGVAQYENDTDQTFVDGNDVQNAEHMIFAGLFYPGLPDGATLRCIF